MSQTEALAKIHRLAEWNDNHDHELAPDELRGLVGLDLSGTDLSSLNLSDAILIKTTLSRSTLEATNLDRANLFLAKVNNASLAKASLSRCNLEEALFKGTNLSSADLSFTQLHLTNLSETDLTDANLSFAQMKKTNLEEAILKGTNLRGASLEEVLLTGATLWNVHLQRTKLIRVHCDWINYHELNSGLQLEIPRDFTRDAGTFLRNPSLILSKSNDHTKKIQLNIQMYKEQLDKLETFHRTAAKSGGVIICYSAADEDIASRINNDLVKDGINCWLDDKNSQVSDLIENIYSDDFPPYLVFLYVLSPNSLKQSWTKREFDRIVYDELHNKRLLLPILAKKLPRKQLPSKIQQLICSDLSRDFASGYKILKGSLDTCLKELLAILKPN